VARTSPSLKGHALALMAPKRRVRGGEDAAQGGGARKTQQKRARTVHFAAPILGEQAGATGPGPSSAPRHSTQSAMLQQQARELEELRCARDADTESDESETVAPAASSGGVEHAGGMKVFRAEHRKKVTTEMMRLDKEAEEEAAELGLLMPRTLQALKTLRATAQQEGSVVVPPLSAGMVLRCKAEVYVKAAEYNELAKRAFSTRHGNKHTRASDVSCFVASCGGRGRCDHLIKV
jgi:hypothetical protein